MVIHKALNPQSPGETMTDKSNRRFNTKNEQLVQAGPKVAGHSPNATYLARELEGIASMVAKLERRPREADTPLTTSEFVEEIRRVRALRAQFFAGGLFADPAWDILLELKHAENQQLVVTVSNLCAAADVPATTALRWISNLVDNGMLVRTSDRFDGRRSYVSLHRTTSEALERFLEQAVSEGTSSQ